MIDNYKLIKEEYLKDIDSNAKIYEHIKSGARVLALENDDDNKVFGIGFRTTPYNSTGVAHILEHSVLNGSRKYKTKRTIYGFDKSSLQTFLNAMTYPDKTIYPIASRNDKDFNNLMDVYLDGVFFPAVKEKKEIFLQEGWHYEINDKDDDIKYKGVVYNEMKGAYSLPDTIMYYQFIKALFPDTIYANESGGDPYKIPDLTYEEFIDFYNKYYHPVNSYIYLYGDMDTEERLRFMDEEYLSHFDKIDLDSSIKGQKPFKEIKRNNIEYSISQEENPENKDMLIYGVRTGEKNNIMDSAVDRVIREILFSNDGSPIKMALLEKGISEDVDDIYADGKELGVGLVAINSSIEKVDEFVDIIETELKKVLEKGLDKEQLESIVNKIEFELKEAGGFPTKGIIFYITALDSWIYDEDPTEQFKFEYIINDLREKIKTDYFERYIEENILNNNHKAIITLKAVPGLNVERDKLVNEKLKNFKDSLSSEEIEQLIEENRKLQEFQNKEDTQEEKDTIPSLKLEDIDSKVLEIPTVVEQKEDYTILYHPIFTGKINYIDLSFDLDFLKEEEIEYLSLLCDLLTMVDTEKYPYTDLDTRIYLETGGLDISANTILNHREEGGYIKRLTVSSKSNVQKTKNMFELISEIIFNSKFDNIKRIREIIQMIKLNFESSSIQNGHSLGITRASSYFSEQGVFNDKLSGIAYYDFLVELEENLEERFEDLQIRLNSISKKVFNRNNMILNITTDEEEKENIVSSSEDLISKLSNEKLDKNTLNLKLEKKNEGIITSSDVNYVIKSCNLKDIGYVYKGSHIVLSNILSSDYLHSEIRAKGGAYGREWDYQEGGNIYYYSYRDPNIKNSIEVYNNSVDYLNNLNLRDKELTQYIIGTITKFDPPIQNFKKGSVALSMYLSGKTTEDLRRSLEEALNTNLEELKELSSTIDYAMKENYMVTIGNSESIKENKELFNSIRQLKK